MPPPYTNRVVAFIDILGFRDLVQRLSEDALLRKSLHRALTEIRGFKHASLRNETAQRDLEVSVFSDSIAISGEPDALMVVISTALGIQSKLLGLGILVRGGISNGPTFHAEDVLYGEGMINAVDLEQRVANHPRIVIDPKLITASEAGLCAMFLSRDNDGYWFIDTFAMGGLPDGSEALVEDGWDPHAVFLDQVGRTIAQNLSELTDERKRTKWSWLQDRHTIALQEYKNHGQPRFWHLWAQLERRGMMSKSKPMKIEPGPAKKASSEWVP